MMKAETRSAETKLLETTSAGTKTVTKKKFVRRPKQIDRAIQAADDKKAIDLVLLDLRKSGGFTDFFFICSGANVRQTRAIADAIREVLAAEGAKPAHVEGYDHGDWILLDYFDFIVHIFAPETRVFYGLERLWGAADRTAIE